MAPTINNGNRHKSRTQAACTAPRMGSWTLIKAFEKGHRYYWDESGRVAVADQSGDDCHGNFGRPEDTDDGILWLDRSRPIMALRFFALPLIKPSGELTSTPISMAEASWLISYLGYRLQIGTTILKAVNS